MVLRFGRNRSEHDVDRKVLHAANHTDINVPSSRKRNSVDVVTSHVAALNLPADPERAASPSRTSQSTQPASDSSSDDKLTTKASSSATGSIASPPSSITSGSSRKSSYVKFKRNVRRLASVRRRRTIDAPMPAFSLPATTIDALRPALETQCLLDGPGSDAAARRKTISSPIDEIPAAQMDPPPASSEDAEADFVSCQRSLSNSQLQFLRNTQREEQDRFNRFEADQHRLMRLRQAERKRAALDRYAQRQQSFRDRHADVLASLEHRHLSAEVDLHRTLQLERQGCETRLRHMQAYCDSKAAIAGMPDRAVTQQHQDLLQQQYHVRNGMDNLHTARINVLREKQAKQLERVKAKQDAEFDTLAREWAEEEEDLAAAAEQEANQLRQEFIGRRSRVVARWTLAEAIERQTLENATGERYGPLPEIPWPEPGTSEAPADDDDRLVHDAIMAYDAATLGML